MIDAPLDELRENCTLAQLPADAAGRSAQVAALEGCVRVREHFGSLHAVLRGTTGEVASRLETELGIAHAVCRHVSLEELFVELVGGDS